MRTTWSAGLRDEGPRIYHRANLQKRLKKPWFLYEHDLENGLSTLM
jgi:hypothetical protein